MKQRILKLQKKNDTERNMERERHGKDQKNEKKGVVT